MPTSEKIVESCLFISGVGCYDVLKDFSGPIVTVVVAYFGIKFTFKQIAVQHNNAIRAQLEESKRNAKINLFKELNQMLDSSGEVIRDTSSYCMAKKYSTLAMKAEISHEEFQSILKNLSNALLAIISKIESHEVINFKLFSVFRFSLQSILHDLLSMQFDKNRVDVLEKILELTSDAQCYLGDFQICMQNMAYGEVFESSVPHRVTVDKRYKVIVDDPQKLEKLKEYFTKETNWGKSCTKYEKEAVKKFHP